MSRYPRLQSLVAGRSVAVLCQKHVAPDAVNEQLTLRFNFDSVPADIYASNFYKDAHSPQVDAAKLVIGTVPCAKVEDATLGIRKDFAADNVATFGLAHIDPEFVSAEHWLALARELPIYPLSGLVALAMLETTSLARCVIYGMDFYYGNYDLPLRQGRFRGRHDILASVAWVTALLRRDWRFGWRGSLDLGEIECHWLIRRAESVGHVPGPTIRKS